MNRPLKASLLAITLVAVSAPAFAADTVVQELEMNTIGGFTAWGSFDLASRLSFLLAIEGGSKFAARLSLGYVSASLERDLFLAGHDLAYPSDPLVAEDLELLYDRVNNPSGPEFRLAEVTLLNMLGFGFDFTWFIGNLPGFCSGDAFASTFGIRPFTTEFLGYASQPDGIGGDRDRSYDGLYSVHGTGIRLATGFGTKWMRLELYGYQDYALTEGGVYSSDVHAMFLFGEVKLEAFFGATFPDPWGVLPLGLYRGGLLFDVKAGDLGEFFVQAGVPAWDAERALTLGDFYFLIEPRVHFGIGSFIVTLFVHPKFYEYELTGEESLVDLNFKLAFGTLDGPFGRAGIETKLTFDPSSTVPMTIVSSLYYGLFFNGVQLELGASADVFPFDPTDAIGSIRTYVGVKTSF